MIVQYAFEIKLSNAINTKLMFEGIVNSHIVLL